MKLPGFLLAACLLPCAALADPCDLIPERGPMPAEVRSGQVFSGSVVYVGDGDSLCVALGPSYAQWAEVRLADFYAPELHDAGDPTTLFSACFPYWEKPLDLTH